MVDHNRLLSAEEESRTFADDTAADKEKKKRAESRRDGGLGTYIAAGTVRRGFLEDDTARALQRAQLRVQGGDEEEDEAVHKEVARYRREIRDLANKLDWHSSLVEDAELIAARFEKNKTKHNKQCQVNAAERAKKEQNPEYKMKLCDRSRPGIQDAEAAAGALLVRASRGGQGERSERSLREVEPKLKDKKAINAMYRFHQHLERVLRWKQGTSCTEDADTVQPSKQARVGTSAGGSGGAAPPGAVGESARPNSNAVGYAKRIFNNVCLNDRALETRLETRAREIAAWMFDESLLETVKPMTKAAAIVRLCYTELLDENDQTIASIPALTDAFVSEQLGKEVKPPTIQKTVAEVMGKRKAFLSARRGGTTAGAGGSSLLAS